jgi:hypothetical protein
MQAYSAPREKGEGSGISHYQRRSIRLSNATTRNKLFKDEGFYLRKSIKLKLLKTVK